MDISLLQVPKWFLGLFVLPSFPTASISDTFWYRGLSTIYRGVARSFFHDWPTSIYKLSMLCSQDLLKDCSLLYFLVKKVFFFKYSLHIRNIQPVSRGTLQTHLKRTQRTARLRTIICEFHRVVSLNPI